MNTRTGLAWSFLTRRSAASAGAGASGDWRRPSLRKHRQRLMAMARKIVLIMLVVLMLGGLLLYRSGDAAQASKGLTGRSDFPARQANVGSGPRSATFSHSVGGSLIEPTAGAVTESDSQTRISNVFQGLPSLALQEQKMILATHNQRTQAAGRNRTDRVQFYSALDSQLLETGGDGPRNLNLYRDGGTLASWLPTNSQPGSGPAALFASVSGQFPADLPK